MQISYNWLKKHVNIHNNAEEVADKLKASTVEVEKVVNQGGDLAEVVVGKVLSADKHPNADKLKVCQVDVGGEKIQIVCGGSNVYEGMLVALAKVGAKVKWHGEGALVELSPTSIRGVESSGMICASTEIGLGEMFPLYEEKEILDLSAFNFVVGMDLSEALKLNDCIFEIDNKSLSNRPDLWGHYGIAREVAVLLNRDLNEYKTKEIKSASGGEIKLNVEVEDQELCPRYMAVAMTGIKIGESPDWLKRDLMAVGMHSINNIVDITNYIMLDLGQPMHAFSADALNVKIKNQNEKLIKVRKARIGEKIITLDNNECELTPDDLVIADEEKAIALAGVMGGIGSGISSGTTTIIFESANFNPVAIRKTSTKFGLRTDSAMRFEKSLDPGMCEVALNKAVEMVMEICPEAKVASKVVDKKHFTLQVGPITVDTDIFRKKLGIEVPEKEILRILNKLGFEIKQKKNFLSLKIPTWRATKDISISEDVVEEVARIFGYNNIPSSLPNFPITPPEKNDLRTLERKIKGILSTGLNYTEVYNYSFVSEAQIKKLGDDLSKYIELENPLSKGKPYLRRNLLPNLLDNLAVNIERSSVIKIFEIGKVFTVEETGARVRANSDDLLPHQDTWLTTICAEKKNDNQFWSARRVVEQVMASLGLEWRVAVLDKILPWEHPARVATFSVGGIVVGVAHELHPSVAQQYGLETRVGITRINLDKLSEIMTKNPVITVYKSLLAYPETMRDVAFLVNKKITHADIVEALDNADHLLKKISIFDVYEGKNIKDGYKSMAFHLTYFHPEKTLTTEEVDKAQMKVINILVQKFQIELRK